MSGALSGKRLRAKYPALIVALIGLLIVFWPTPATCFLFLCYPNYGTMVVKFVVGMTFIIIGLISFIR